MISALKYEEGQEREGVARIHPTIPLRHGHGVGNIAPIASSTALTTFRIRSRGGGVFGSAGRVCSGHIERRYWGSRHDLGILRVIRGALD